jgi:hypothetical protein
MKSFKTRGALSVRLRSIASRSSCLTALLILGALVCTGQAPSGAEGWVVLPVDEYRALRHAAFPAELEPEPPPVEATLSRVDYDLKVDGELATGEARLTVDVIKEGWVRVAIPRGLMVSEARLDGRPVSLVTRTKEKGSGTSELLLSRTGRATLTLAIVAPVSSVAGTEMLQLPVSSSSVSRVSLVLAGKTDRGVEMRITGGLLMDRSETPTETRWTAYGRGNEALTFAWRRRTEDQRAIQALRMRGALTQVVGLGEDTTQVNAEVQVEVLQGLASEVRIKLPEQFNVNQVSGAMVADWEALAGELAVTFIDPVQQTTRFTVSGEVRLAREGQIDIPLLRLSTAERETGGVAVEVLGAGEIKDRQSIGLEEGEAAELGQLISSRQSPSLVAFRLRPAEGKSPRSLSLRVARYTPQAVLTANVEEAQYSALITADGKMLVHARFAVRNNQRSFLKFDLPAGAVLWSASAAGRPVRPGKAPNGSLLLPLEKSRSGEEAPAFAVEVAYLVRLESWGDKGRTRLSLLTLDMPISRSGLLVHFSPLFRLTAAPGNFRVSPYELPKAAVLRPGSQPSGVHLQVSPGSVDKSTTDTTRELLARLQQAGRVSRPTRNLPIRVAFPRFGPSIFLVSELTSENQTPVLELDFQRDRKRGEK